MMERKIKIYLSFIGNTDPIDQWNSEFSYYFSMVAKQILGYAPELFSNMQVSGAEFQREETVDRLSDKDAVIFILNSNAKSSDLEQIEGLLPDISLVNTFLVMRTYQKKLVIPASLKALPSYLFFDHNPYNLEVTEYKPEGQGEAQEEFWNKITDLIYDIKLTFITHKSDSDFYSKKTIYLAEVAVDQLKNRERLCRELQLSGYRVLPEKPLPVSLKEFEEAVAHMLPLCFFTVHIMGETYGDTPTGYDYSFVEIQNRVYSNLFVKKDEDEEVQIPRRIVWFPPVFEPFEDKQKQYLKRLKKEIVDSQHTELVHSTLFDLKNVIDLKYADISSENISQTNNLNSILVVPDLHHSSIVRMVEEKFQQKVLNYEILSHQTGQINNIISRINEIRKHHTFLIVNSQSDDVWVHSVISILMRSKIQELQDQKCSISILTPALGIVPKCPALTMSSFVYNKNNMDGVIDSLITSF
jgi:hypothetical protein